jgi:putative ABC transport system ATP-binding protein
VLAVTHDHRTLGYADRILGIEDGKINSDKRPAKGSGNGHDGAGSHDPGA